LSTEIKNKQPKSYGELRKAKKTKINSPDLTGTIKVRADTIAAISDRGVDLDAEEVLCSVAAWKKEDCDGSPFFTIVLSSPFVPAQKCNVRLPAYDEVGKVTEL
jgi:hypothetical protein